MSRESELILSFTKRSLVDRIVRTADFYLHLGIILVSLLGIPRIDSEISFLLYFVMIFPLAYSIYSKPAYIYSITRDGDTVCFRWLQYFNEMEHTTNISDIEVRLDSFYKIGDRSLVVSFGEIDIIQSITGEWTRKTQDELIKYFRK